MSTVFSSNNQNATAYSNQRKIDRTSNGVVHALFIDYDTLYTSSSQNNGSTWSRTLVTVSGFAALAKSASFFIDEDDYAHVVWKDFGSYGLSQDYLYYMRGTPNAGKTAWTWSSPVAVTLSTYGNYPDLVAHREGSGWTVHVVYSYIQTTVIDAIEYVPLSISSGGTVTNGSTVRFTDHNVYGVEKWPSIDFQHTGDGKTAANNTPHLFVAWSAGQSGAGYGIRFKKATYNAGSWSWGTEREIDNTVYIDNSSHWVNCMFDGTRIIITGSLKQTWSVLAIYERDVADTTTTTKLKFNSNTTSYLLYGSATYDSLGNIFAWGRWDPPSSVSGTRGLIYHQWERETGVLSGQMSVDTTGSDTPYFAAKRGHSGSKLEYIYTDGTTAPYNVVYGSLAVNTPPEVSITAPVASEIVDPRLPLTVAWTYSDVESTPQSFAEIVARGEPTSFYYTGANQTYVVPMGVDAVEVECYGAAGGGMVNGVNARAAGGAGGYARSVISVTPGESLTVIAGGMGVDGGINKSTSPGGYGGGGNGGTTLNSTNYSGGSGGGRSAILRGSTQLVVAGGGGGSSSSSGSSTFYYGGDGGGKLGKNGTGAYAGLGATQTAGGSGGDGPSDLSGTLDQGTAGTTGQGGAGANAYSNTNNSYAAAGGGGGYFGGGGGGISGTAGNSGSGYAGGGGSSYIVGAGVTTAGVNAGDGSVAIRVAHIVSGNSTTSSIPANEMEDESSYEIYVAVSDGSMSNSASISITADSWTYGPEVISGTEAGTLDTSSFDGGDYEVQVRTADAEYFGPWSISASLVVLLSNVMVYLAGSWTSAQRKIRQGGTWKDHNPQKLP
jgi:hypothetical protein